MKVGVAVTLTGLKQRPDLNGRRGYLVDRQHRDGYQVEDMQRWPVQLIANTSQDRPAPSAESDDRLLVREQNLIAEPAADAPRHCPGSVCGNGRARHQLPLAPSRTVPLVMAP